MSLEYVITRAPGGEYGFFPDDSGTPFEGELGRSATRPPADFVWDNGVARAPNFAEIVEAARVARLAELEALYKSIVYGGFQFDGMWFKSTSTSQRNIVGRSTKLISGRPYTLPIHWLKMDGTQFDFADSEDEGARDMFLRFADALDTHVETCVFVSTTLEGAIAQSADPASIDIRAGWPPSPVLSSG